MSTGFGQWYNEQKTDDAAASSNSSSWFDIEQQGFPTFSTEGMPQFSFEGMKQTMEAQMPKKILGMGYQQRFQVFCAMLLLSVLFFALAFFVGLPTIMFKPQKFALSFTCGSLMFMASFGILTGPMEHIKGMCAPDRMLFTTIYLGSMFVTLYLTCTKGGLQGYALVMISSGVQLLALLWYLVSFLPGGTMGLSIVMRAMVTMLKPILGTCIRMQAMCISTCIGWMTRS
uniref:Vesicle transport protein n=1 Tax=Craspedostauros australis TaxID=1486917 RepID=A0A7R9ZII6_9STRA|mmetsp:Transcript_12561/g.34610  ORF Transcript_12561/g.34610 Transcript_12561/m.34610 type:complete len:229 (+) Transcript_12561:324-1010(+)